MPYEMAGFAKLLQHVDQTLMLQGMQSMDMEAGDGFPKPDAAEQFQQRQSQVNNGPESQHTALPVYYGSIASKPRPSRQEHTSLTNLHLDPTLTVQAAFQNLHGMLQEVSVEVQRWSRDMAEAQLEDTFKRKRAFAIKVKTFASRLRSFSAALRVGRPDWDFCMVPHTLLTSTKTLLDIVVEQCRIPQQRPGQIGLLFRNPLYIRSLNVKTRLLKLEKLRAAQIHADSVKIDAELAHCLEGLMAIED